MGVSKLLAIVALILAVLALFSVAAPIPLLPVAVVCLAVAMLV